jgi:hypothetical protein
MKYNFRRGGLFLAPATALAAIIAILLNAPLPALASICIFGFTMAIILMLLGNKRPQNNM